MNISGIQSIQIQQGRPRTRDNNAPPASANLATTESSTVAQSVHGQLQGVLNNIDSMKQQLDLITLYFPPFFPIAAPLRIEWIIKLNEAQIEAAKVAGTTGDKRISFAPQRLKENATDAEIVSAIQNLAHFRQEAAQIIPAATDNKKPGAFVSIKV